MNYQLIFKHQADLPILKSLHFSHISSLQFLQQMLHLKKKENRTVPFVKEFNFEHNFCTENNLIYLPVSFIIYYQYFQIFFVNLLDSSKVDIHFELVFILTCF